MAKNKNQNTIWLVILAVVLLFIWPNASPKSSQVGAQESQSGFDGELDRGNNEWNSGGSESFLPQFGPGDQEGGGRVGVFKPGSKLDNFLCGKKKPSGGGGNCGSHYDDGHVHVKAHGCPNQ